MNKVFAITLVCTLFCLSVTAQKIVPLSEINDTLKHKNAQVVKAQINGKDTTLNVELGKVIVIPLRQFKNLEERLVYDKLTRQIRKVYPYAILIKKTFRDIETTLDSLPTRRQQKQYIKDREAELRKDFEDELIKLTFSEGRLLVKLVDRETGHTTYDVVKELKGNMSAFFWQSVGMMFGTSLKSEYDAEGTDKMIEEIIIKIENAQI